jgi:hypothetical protein
MGTLYFLLIALLVLGIAACRWGATSFSRLACTHSASRSGGLWIITLIGTSSLVSPVLVWKTCRIRQSFATIILSPRASACL